MQAWKIQARDALIFRDGKPFSADAGVRAKSLPFPLPATIVGAVRTMAGTEAETGTFCAEKIPELLTVEIKGPLLIEETADSQMHLMAPAPADCLVLPGNKKGEIRRKWLQPIERNEGELTNLENRFLIGPTNIIKEKPYKDAPHYWEWESFMAWLTAPQDDVRELNRLGHTGPGVEHRTHVAMDAETGTGLDGALFQTSGLEFTYLKEVKEKIPALSEAKRLHLYVETDAEINAGLGFLGGERRVVRWIQTNSLFPGCPGKIREQIIQHKACRLTLLTPAIFNEGFYPGWLEKEYSIKVSGATLPRYEVVSGWDYEKGTPKATRRLAPAGSVYYLRLEKEAEPEEFIEKIWLQNISDEEQDRRDGFGLAILGIWDGKLKKMTMEVRG